MITKNITVCFIGGDERHKYAALYLANILKTNVTGSIFIGAEHPNINRFENPIKAAHEAKVQPDDMDLIISLTAGEYPLP